MMNVWSIRATPQAGGNLLRSVPVTLLLLLLTLTSGAATAGAQSVSLAWDRAASHTNLSAFILKWGVTSGSYTGQVSVATNLTTTTVNNLVPGVRYFFAVTARNVAGLESDPSNEISYTIPGGNSNARPVANAGSTSTSEDQSKSITLSGSDADGDTLTYTILTNPSNGALSGTPPNLTYTPTANFNGSDSFTFRVNDGETNSAAATFSITVTAVNDAPTLNALSNVTVAEDSGNRTVNLSGIGTGAGNETQTLTVTASSSRPGLIPTPTVNYSSPSTSGSIVFRPVANSNGTANITVTVSDGQSQNGTVSRTFTVTVSGDNDSPTISDIVDRTIAEGSSTPALSFSISDPETSSSALTVTGTSSNTGVVPNSGIVFGGSGASRNVTVTPAALAFGSSVITIQVSDGNGGTATDSFTLTVTPVNQAPTLNSLSNLTIAEDSGARTISLSGITTGASNEIQTLTVTASSSNTGLIPTPTVNYSSPNSTGSLSVTPVANASGAATITVTVSDGQSQSSTVSRTFTVTVTNVNDLPTISNIPNQTVSEGSATAVIPFTIGDLETAVNSLTLTATSSNPTLVPSGNANITLGGSGANRTVKVTPAALQFGAATITITARDASGGTATDSFVVTVTPVNQQPTLNSIGNVTMNEDAGMQTVSLAGIGTGAANETDTLTVTASSSNTGVIPNPSVSYTSPNATGSLTFTPVANASGSAVITVTVNDGQSQSNTVVRTFNVTVNPVNDAPTLAALSARVIDEDAGLQTVSLSGITSGASNESQALTVTASSSSPSLIPTPAVSYSSPNSTGSISFRPTTNSTGSAVITVTVNDGQSANNSVSRTFTVTVRGVNDAPTISAIDDQYVDQENSTPIIPFTIFDTETPPVSLVLSATSSNPTLVPTNNIVLGGAGAGRTVQVSPASGRSGSAEITLVVSDGSGGVATEVFTVFVNSVNQPPTLDPIDGIALSEDAPTQTIPLAGISTGAFGELQTLTVTASSSDPSLIPNPTVSYSSPNFTGSLQITPAANASGSATISVTVNDGQSANNTVTRQFTVIVEPVNDAPTITDIPNQTVNQNTPTGTIPFFIGDVETPLAGMTLAATSSDQSLVPNSNIVIGGSGSNRNVRLTPINGKFGSAVITVTVSDGTGGVNSDSFILNVTAVNAQPTLDSLNDQIVIEDSGEQTINLTGITSGSAQEEQTLIVTAVSSDTNLFDHPIVTYSSPGSTGTLRFTPRVNAFGAATITVVVDDGQAQNGTVSQVFTVTVNAVNDRPTLAPLANLAISQNASAQVVSLLGISSGADNENQNLVVTATSNNPDLIADPSVSYSSPNILGSLTLVPAPNAVGSATITVIVDDGQETDNLVVRTFTVTVSGANSPPSISSFADRTIPMNGVVASVPFTIGDLETPAEYLRVGVHSSNPSLVYTNDVVFSGTGSNRVTSIMTTRSQHGFSVITYTVYDTNGASASSSFVLTVVPPNSRPTLDSIPSMFVDEDSGPHFIPLTGISAGGSNDVNQTLIVSARSENPGVIPHPTIDYSSPNSSGTLIFAPVSNITGSATIVVTVNDGQSLDNLITRTFGVIVEGENDPPTISAILPQNVEQNTPTVAIPFIVNDLEIPADNIAVAASSSDETIVSNENIVLAGRNANRTITVTPVTGKSGTVIITVFASDGALSASTSFLLTVGSGNTPPVLATPASLLAESYVEAEVPVVVTDRETRPDDLVLTAASLNTSVLPDENISFSGSGSNRVMKCRPVAGKSGNVMVNLSLSDGKHQTRRSVQLNIQVGTPPSSRLSVRRNGRGTIKPELDGELLTVGKTYTITAFPASDEVFVEWGRGAHSRNPKVTFVMTSNLVLEVTFTNNPFMSRKGLYNGLFYETAEIRPESSGSITVTPTERGTYSGKMRIGPANYSISGSLDLAQKGTNVLSRKGASSLVVELDFGSSSNQLVGRVTDGEWEAPLIADRNVYSKVNPCALAGTYTLVLPGQADPADGPEGDGYGSVKVDGAGMASLVGVLADGSKFTCKSPVSVLGQWPVYSFAAGSTVISWLTFADRPTDDITGLMSWVKPSQARSKFYRNGLTNEMLAVGSVFVRPADRDGTLLELSETTISFSGGNLASPFSNDIIWGAKNKITNLSDNKLKLSVNPSTGLFTGSVADPESRKSSKFAGAVLQKQNRGSGFMLGTDASSLVVIGE